MDSNEILQLQTQPVYLSANIADSPPEIIAHVASFIGNQKTVLNSIGLVSRYFNTVVQHNPILCRHFCNNDLCSEQTVCIGRFQTQSKTISIRALKPDQIIHKIQFIEHRLEQVIDVLNRYPQIHHLNYRALIINDKDMKSFAEFMETNTSLTYLRLHSRFQLDYNNSDFFASFIRTNTTLRTLNLQNCFISSKGLQTLADCFKINTTLENLNLDFNHSVKNRDQLFAELLTNNTLKTLSLNYCNLTNHRIQPIATELMRNSSIRELSLMYNSIDDTGATYLLSAMEKNRRIRIDVGMNRISADHPIWTVIVARSSRTA
jgi:hypothetical protein